MRKVKSIKNRWFNKTKGKIEDTWNRHISQVFSSHYKDSRHVLNYLEKINKTS